MQVREFLSYLNGVKKNGSGWTALCPAHDDKKQSLSIDEKDGRILLHCFAGCTTEAIVSALGLEMRDLFTDKPQSPAHLMSTYTTTYTAPPKTTQKPEPKKAAEYVYTDEAGNPLYRKVRLEPKGFYQEAWDAENKRWVPNLDGARRVIYNLLRVIESIKKGETIFLVEGEKDVESLGGIGLTATTAGSTGDWRTEFREFFHGADVVILPDNDAAGKRLAETEASDLCDTAECIRILELPNLPAKGDVSDWIAAGGAKEELLELVGDAPVWEMKTPEPEDDSGGEYITKDYAHAKVLAELFKDKYRWVMGAGKRKKTSAGYWICYKNGVWVPIPEEILEKDASDALRQRYVREIAETKDRNDVRELAKKIEDSCTHARITGALNFVKGWEGVVTDPQNLDKEGYLLNCKNGVVNLKTLELMPHSPDYLFTKQVNANYKPEIKSPVWEAHLRRFLPNDNIRRQVQRDLGMALIGEATYQVLPIWWGTGGNGKSTTAKVVQTILDDYAGKAAPDLLAESRFERHPTEIADLYGKRVVFSIEMDKIKRLDEGKTKELTGGDIVKARYMGEDFWEFVPTHTLFLLVNQKPTVTGTDYALWRRIRLVPWNERITKEEMRPQDEVIAELLSEADGILTWLVEGLRDWKADMTWIAPEVVQETEVYLSESDPIADFLAACCELKPNAKELKRDVYTAYEEWCAENLERPVSQKMFTLHLSNRGVGEYRNRKGQRYYLGINLRKDHNPTDDDDFSPEIERETVMMTDDDTFTRRFPNFEKIPYKYRKSVIMCHHPDFERENRLETATQVLEDDPFTDITQQTDQTFPPRPDNCFHCGAADWILIDEAAAGNGDWVCKSCHCALSLTRRMYPDKAQKAGFG